MSRLSDVALRHGIPQYISGLANNPEVENDAEFLTGTPVPVGGLSGEYAKFDKDNGWRIPETKVASDDPLGVKLDFGGTKDTVTLDEHGANAPFPTAGKSDSLLAMDLRTRGVMAAHALRLGRLKRVLDLASDSAGSTVTIDLTSTSTKAVKELQAAVDTVILGSGGSAAGVDVRILWFPQALREFLDHSSVSGRVTGGATKKDPATINSGRNEPQDMQALERLIGRGVRCRESNAAYVSSKPGQAITRAFMGTTSIYVAAVSQMPTGFDPSWAKVFQQSDIDGNIFEPKYATHFANTMEYAIWRWHEKLVATNTDAIVKVTFTV